VSTKLAVVTGASKGLGLMVAKEFAANGWQVVGTGRSERPADLPEAAAYEQFDASDAEACELFWKKLAGEHPDAEVCLVNNAGAYVGGSLLETKAEDYHAQMHAIYFTSVYMTRGMALVVPKARVINIVSNSALTANVGESAYGAAKAAQMHFFQSLQEEYEPSKYQITNIYPSDIATHGPSPDAIDPKDLAAFVRQQTENNSTYYLRDATIYPTK